MYKPATSIIYGYLVSNQITIAMSFPYLAAPNTTPFPKGRVSLGPITSMCVYVTYRNSYECEAQTVEITIQSDISNSHVKRDTHARLAARIPVVGI